jgi:hypothetical protein
MILKSLGLNFFGEIIKEFKNGISTTINITFFQVGVMDSIK